MRNESPALSRYDRDPDGRVIVEIATRAAKDLFNHFDRFAPYPKKDLSQDLSDYLFESAQEIGNAPFLLQVQVEEAIPSLPQAEIAQGFIGFFQLQAAQARKRMMTLLRRSFVLLGFGLLLLAAFFVLGGGQPPGHWASRMALEGLVVAAWIALWEGTTQILFEVPRERQSARVFKRLALAEIRFGS